jgi:LmbE family N-acetylglucosaminyl deacetylase/CheY-like chemotaxis protein
MRDNRTGEHRSQGEKQGRERFVLLVEDDEILAEVVVEVLDSVAEVSWAESAERALELLPERRWDLIVADIELPETNGIEFVGNAKGIDPALSTLIVSGRSSFDYAIGAIRAGADDYMTKPLEPAALIAKVEELMDATTRRRAEGHEQVLAIGAHPDDVEIGVGGILLRHADSGDDVSILTLTGGEHGGAVGQRALESERAAELISARLFHAALPDRSVNDGAETISEIKRVIDETDPTTIYTHTPRDVHQDHRNVHHATLVAARQVPRVLCYQAPSSTVDFRPTRFVSIDAFLDRKLEAIRAYGSQSEIRDYLDEELLRSTARYWARFANCRYVEPLEVVRDADLADPVETTTPDRQGVLADAR